MEAVKQSKVEHGLSRLPRWTRNELLWTAVVFIGVAVTTWLRIAPAEQQALWAEDGPVFLRQQLENGTFASLLQPYAGYQHFLPRLFAAGLVEFVPIEHFDRGVFILCVLFAGFVGAATFRLTRGILRWLPARFLMAIIPVMVPLLSREIIGDLANIHTYCLWLVAWIAVAKIDSRREGIFWAVVALACVLSEFQAVVVVPFMLLRLFWTRTFSHVAVSIGALLGASVQVFTWLNYPRGTESDEVVEIADVIIGWLANAILPIWNGDVEANAVYLAENGTWFLWLGLIPFALAAIIALVCGKNPERFALITLLLVSGATFGGSLIVNPFWFFRFADIEGEVWLLVLLNLRYGASAGMFALACLPFAASAFVSRLSPKLPVFSRVAALAVTLLLFAYIAMQWPEVDNARDEGAAWTPQWREAVAVCEANPDAIHQFETAPEFRKFEIRCADVLQLPGS